MTDPNSPPPDDLTRLQAAIAAQEALRGLLPDDQLEATLAALRGQVTRLQAASAAHGSAVAQEGSTAVAERGVNVGGAAGIIATGDRNVIIVVADAAAASFWRQFSPTAAPPVDDLRQATARYLAFLIERYRYLDFRGMGIADRVPLRLPLLNMYVPLKARVELPEGDTWARELRLAGRRVSPEEAETIGQRLSQPLPVLDLLQANDGLIILGDPGAGKTTFLKVLTLRLALGEGDVLGIGPRLPVLLPLSAYANALAARDIPLDRFLGEYYNGLGIELPMVELLREALDRGAALLLLDGLDEVRDQSRRGLVLERVMTFCAFRRPAGNKFILTSRIVGYKEIRATAEGLAECTLVDFDDEEIALFVDRWTAAVEQAASGASPVAAGDAVRERSELQASIERNPGVRLLAANPLLLTILALMKRQGVTLPERRVELYEQYVKTLVKHWNLGRGLDRRDARDIDIIETVRILAPLALWMHETSPGVGLVKQEALRRRLAAIYAERGHPDPEVAARQLLRDARDHAGLLVERGRGTFGFIHLTFQEYLAAVAIAQTGQSDLQPIVDELSRHIGNDSWREVFILTISYLGIVQQRDEAAAEVLRLLLDAPPGEPGQAVVLAGAAAVDAWPGGITPPGRDRVVRAVLAILSDLGVAPLKRAEAGRVLARLGDPRREVMDVDAMPFCCVPAGPFWMGSPDDDPDADDSEKPLHQLDLPFDFWIGQYPVTNAQFQAFVAGDGYGHEPYWPEAIRAGFWRDGRFKGRWDSDWRVGPYNYGDPFNLPNHPVIGLTWYEALAFTRWLTGRWRAASLLPQELSVLLPSEAEWEKGARGGLRIPAEPVPAFPGNWIKAKGLRDNPRPQRRYPWGDEWETGKANGEETAIGSTNAASVFATQDNVHGAAELAGNVFEWTRSRFNVYPYRPDDGREAVATVKPDDLIVIRGGYYGGEAGWLRCAFRGWDLPYFGGYDLGFRVVVSPISPTSGL